MKKNKSMWNPLTKTIFTRLLIVLAIYTAVLLFFFVASDTILSLTVWRGTELFYPLLRFINVNRVIVVLFVWGIGLFIIFLYYLNKSLNYMNVLMNASSELINQDEKWIKLPTELSDVEKRLNEIKQTSIKNAKIAEENERRKNDLIVYLAHDIKTPLTSIVGYLTLLNDEKEISEATRDKYINITLEKSFKLENLTNELFDVARYNSENIILEKEDFNVNLMIEQIIDEFYPILKEKNKTIKFDSDGRVMYFGDPMKLARVFNNIIKNAINYSYEETEITVNLSVNSKDVILEVTSFGDKISELQKAKIFDKFYRADYSRTSKTGGSGLGLAISKDIVDLHKGSISVESDKCTTFKVTLPL